MAESKLKMTCDASAMILFTEFFKLALQVSQRSFNFSDFSFEMVRVETDLGVTATGDVIVRLYPSDAFIDFAAAIFAGDFSFDVIK